MSFNLKNKKGPIAEINVTPLVDVMLVLLVIFMISAPLMFSGIKLDLPKTKKVNSLNLTKKQVILSINAGGDFFLGQDEIKSEKLVDSINAKFKEHGTDVLYLRADYALEYGRVAKLMSRLKLSGVAKIALVTQIDEKS